MSRKETLHKVKSLQTLINIFSVDDKIIGLASGSYIKDFADSIQYHLAKKEGAGIF
ncbi:hypothetical protein LEP1GSC133_4657 [Leptospira borgpetersenii serovar Pomona str. 200901868]|nr:hypothetical protein LEP1GSC133_4657 [Leptospira borgpetersenii serovar Pomona str. 200901868]